MRLPRMILAAALLAGVGNIATVHTASATSLAPLTIDELTDASTYIVEGTVERVWVEEDDNGVVWTRAELRVDTVFKGPDAPETVVIDAMGGHSWTRSTMVEAQARFSEGERALVFLDTIKGGTRLTPAGMFHGKFTIRRAAGDTRRHAMRWVGRPNAPFDAQFLPYPERDERLYIDDLHSQIRDSLADGWTGNAIPGISADKLEHINLPEKRQVRIVREATP